MSRNSTDFCVFCIDLYIVAILNSFTRPFFFFLFLSIFCLQGYAFVNRNTFDLFSGLDSLLFRFLA